MLTPVEMLPPSDLLSVRRRMLQPVERTWHGAEQLVDLGTDSHSLHHLVGGGAVPDPAGATGGRQQQAADAGVGGGRGEEGVAGHGDSRGGRESGGRQRGEAEGAAAFCLRATADGGVSLSPRWGLRV